jgi:hypothetical protein
MFTAEIAWLAGFGVHGIAWGCIGAAKRREMTSCGSAVARGRDRILVDMVIWIHMVRGSHAFISWEVEKLIRIVILKACELTERSERNIREGEEIDVEVDTSAIVVGNAGDLALNGLVCLEDGLEGDAQRIVLGDEGICAVADFLGGTQKGQESEREESEEGYPGGEHHTIISRVIVEVENSVATWLSFATVLRLVKKEWAERAQDQTFQSSEKKLYRFKTRRNCRFEFVKQLQVSLK